MVNSANKNFRIFSGLFWRQYVLKTICYEDNSDLHILEQNIHYIVCFFAVTITFWFQQIPHCRKYLAATVILASIAWPSQYWKRRALNHVDSYSINYRILILVYFSFWLYVEWRSPITLHFQPVIESLKSTSSHFSNSLQYPHVWHTVSRLL